jgi:hypothetical protein
MSQRSRARMYETLPDLLPELVPALSASKPCPGEWPSLDARPAAVDAASAGSCRRAARVGDVRRVHRGGRSGRRLLASGPAGRLLPWGRHVDLGDPERAHQPCRAARRDLREMREPSRRGVPVVFPALRRRHVPSDPRRGGGRQNRTGDGGRQPAGVRHPDRTVLRAVCTGIAIATAGVTRG